MLIRIAIAFTLCTLVGCASLPEQVDLDKQLAQLNVAENVWRSQAVTEYQYRSKSFGRSDNPYSPFPVIFSKSNKEPDVDKLIGAIIVIKNGEYSGSYYETDPSYEAHHFGGFNKMFMGIRETIRNLRSETNTSIEVDYHSEYGFPTRITSKQYKKNKLTSISFEYVDQFQVD